MFPDIQGGKKVEEQPAHLLRLLLLHPVPRAVDQMEATIREHAVVRILSTAPGV